MINVVELRHFPQDIFKLTDFPLSGLQNVDDKSASGLFN